MRLAFSYDHLVHRTFPGVKFDVMKRYLDIWNDDPCSLPCFSKVFPSVWLWTSWSENRNLLPSENLDYLRAHECLSKLSIFSLLRVSTEIVLIVAYNNFAEESAYCLRVAWYQLRCWAHCVPYSVHGASKHLFSIKPQVQDITTFISQRVGLFCRSPSKSPLSYCLVIFYSNIVW